MQLWCTFVLYYIILLSAKPKFRIQFQRKQDIVWTIPFTLRTCHWCPCHGLLNMQQNGGWVGDYITCTKTTSTCTPCANHVLFRAQYIIGPIDLQGKAEYKTNVWSICVCKLWLMFYIQWRRFTPNMYAQAQAFSVFAYCAGAFALHRETSLRMVG